MKTPWLGLNNTNNTSTTLSKRISKVYYRVKNFLKAGVKVVIVV